MDKFQALLVGDGPVRAEITFMAADADVADDLAEDLARALGPLVGALEVDAVYEMS